VRIPAIDANVEGVPSWWIPVLLCAALGITPPIALGQSRHDLCMQACNTGCDAFPAGSNQQFNCIKDCPSRCQADWSAIAYSWKDKIAGWSYGQTNRASAESLAIHYCVRQGGVHCVLQTAFEQPCGAVAADGISIGWATDSSRGRAERRALAECAKQGGSKCAVQAWTCSSGAGVSDTGSNTVPVRPSAQPRAASWGAIAYSPRDNGAGWSRAEPDRSSAEREALRVCSERGKFCVLETVFNRACAALSADRDFVGWGTSADMREAQQKATAACRKAGGAGCALHIAFCSY
jgi:Domain of unknown function (DUF4189)